jgi:hypothetical protein
MYPEKYRRLSKVRILRPGSHSSLVSWIYSMQNERLWICFHQRANLLECAFAFLEIGTAKRLRSVKSARPSERYGGTDAVHCFGNQCRPLGNADLFGPRSDRLDLGCALGKCPFNQPSCSPSQATPPSRHRDNRGENPQDSEPTAVGSFQRSVG